MTAERLCESHNKHYITFMSDTAAPTPACPICGKPRVQQFRPFCSKRCADVDLNRWLKGVYAVPVTENDDEDGDKIKDEPAER